MSVYGTGYSYQPMGFQSLGSEGDPASGMGGSGKGGTPIDPNAGRAGTVGGGMIPSVAEPNGVGPNLFSNPITTGSGMGVDWNPAATKPSAQTYKDMQYRAWSPNQGQGSTWGYGTYADLLKGEQGNGINYYDATKGKKTAPGRYIDGYGNHKEGATFRVAQPFGNSVETNFGGGFLTTPNGKQEAINGKDMSPGSTNNPGYYNQYNQFVPTGSMANPTSYEQLYKTMGSLDNEQLLGVDSKDYAARFQQAAQDNSNNYANTIYAAKQKKLGLDQEKSSDFLQSAYNTLLDRLNNSYLL